jgi:HK97 family phage prohead protease
MDDESPRTRTIERGPDGRIRKGFSLDTSEIKLWSETVERDDGDDVEVDMIRVPVSSTGTDRDGDQFSREGLEDMVEQLQSGEVPLFPNHGLDEQGFPTYRFEDQMGGWKDGEIEDDTAYGVAALSPEDDRAQTLKRQIENGVVPVSFSVGFMPLTSEPRTNDEGEQVGRTFHEHDLFEISTVGIPSNDDATVATARAAAKGLAVAKGVDDPETIESLAREVATEVKAGTPLEEALDAEGPTIQEQDMSKSNTQDGTEEAGEDGGDDDQQTLDVDVHREIVRDELAPLKEQVEELREAVDRLLEREGDDEDDEDEEEEGEGEEDEEEDSAGAQVEAIDELRSELEELREQNAELRQRLEEADVVEPKGGRKITPAEVQDDNQGGSAGGETNSPTTTNSRVDDDPDPDLTRLQEALKE